MPPVLIAAALVVLAFLAVKKSPAPTAPPEQGDPTNDPVIGKVWDGTVPDPFVPGVRLPALPLTFGGKLSGWYNPFDRRLVAILDASTKVVIGMTPTTHFPAVMP